jgi:two-component system, OmpR family, phosphate regulon response regulator PhoB
MQLEDQRLAGRGTTVAAKPRPIEPQVARILVVDDDTVVRRLVRDGLEREGFDVTEAGDGTAALAAVESARPDLVILDVNLPVVGGFDVLARLRERSPLPVILLSGRGTEIDRVLGLELGADDYVVKPFSPRELASRVRAVLRRAGDDRRPRLDFGDITFDVARREVYKRGTLVELRAKEFDLLVFLAGAPRRVFSRAELLEHVWQSMPGWQDLATVTEHVRRVRHKLEDDHEHPRWIRTVRGAGYVFEP